MTKAEINLWNTKTYRSVLWAAVCVFVVGCVLFGLALFIPRQTTYNYTYNYAPQPAEMWDMSDDVGEYDDMKGIAGKGNKR